MRPWNVLVTSLEGARSAVRHALRPFARLGGSGYRNVLVGLVADRDAFLAAVANELTRSPILPHALGRVVPIDATVALGGEDPVAAVVDAVLPLVDRLGGASFFVRVTRRGRADDVDTPTFERMVGDAIWQRLVARGMAPRVDFSDPDGIVAVETVGEHAGIGIIPRALRERYPFVRVR